MEVNGVDSLNLEDILAGRKNRQTFHWFLDEIASVVVGISVYEKVKCIKPPTEWLTPTLEGFCLLCVQNFFECIKSKARKEENGAKALWTSEGRGSRKNRGWKQEGICRYNELVNQVRADRVAYPREDSIYLNAKQEERMQYESERLKKKQEDLSQREHGLEAAQDDFSSSESEEE